MNKMIKIEDCIAGYCGDITLDTNHELKEYNENIEYKTTDLLKDYIVLHERISVLYKILDINRHVSYDQIDSTHTKIKVFDLLYSVSLSKMKIKKLGLMKCKEDMAFISVRNRNNYFRDIKNEIKRYHRLQSNIQNILNDNRVNKNNILLYRKYNTEEVPSQFKNNMNYSYRLLWKSGELPSNW